MSSKRRDVDLLHRALSEVIIWCFYRVYNVLGYGFLGQVYENSLVVELEKRGLKVKQQEPVLVYFEDEVVGEFIANIIVEDKIILELKTAETIEEVHLDQLQNYIVKSPPVRLGYLLNFGPKPTFRRIVLNQSQSSAAVKRDPV
ncbi:MAG: GxxExxY protein [Candidatus Promineifilaceae bacterium]